LIDTPLPWRLRVWGRNRSPESEKAFHDTVAEGLGEGTLDEVPLPQTSSAPIPPFQPQWGSREGAQERPGGLPIGVIVDVGLHGRGSKRRLIVPRD
jgi:hypothetical protein